jgi:hypothetical protein
VVVKLRDQFGNPVDVPGEQIQVMAGGPAGTTSFTRHGVDELSDVHHFLAEFSATGDHAQEFF